MYDSNQTLAHKETLKLAALHPEPDGSAFNWQLGSHEGKTRFIDENGNIFFDNVNDYKPITNFLGQYQSGYDREQNKYVDVTLKQYLIDDSEREIKNKILV